MNVKQLLLAQFAACYDENGWFVALKNALANLSAEQASWKPAGIDNSIRETLAHLNYYNNAYLQRFKGIDYVYAIADNRESFAAADSWPAEIERLEALMSEWRALLEAADETKLAAPVSEKNPAPWAMILAHINAHNAHHGGQIVILRKLQGSWDASKGVS